MQIKADNTIRPVFGKDVNLTEYTIEPMIQQKGTFRYVTWVDIDHLVLGENQGIRLKDGGAERDARVNAFKSKFSSRGWKTKYHPPIISTKGTVKEGRGRIDAARALGQSYLPCYVYEFEDDTDTRNNVTNGLIANSAHDPSYSTELPDIISAGKYLIRKNELIRSEEAIEHWFNELNIANAMGPVEIGKAKKAILNSVDDSGDELMRVLNRSDWIVALKKSGIPIEDGSPFTQCRMIVNVDNVTYLERAWCDIVDKASTTAAPVELIFFTAKYDPKDAAMNMNEAVTKLENLWKDTVTTVSKCAGITGWRDLAKPFKILGAVPQIRDVHFVDGEQTKIELINPTNYLEDRKVIKIG